MSGGPACMDSWMKRKSYKRAALQACTLFGALRGQNASTLGEYLTEVWLYVSVRALIKKKDISWQKEWNKDKEREREQGRGKRKRKYELKK